MSRLIWSMGFAGLALACAVAAWLHRPVELPSQTAEPKASTSLAQAPTARPRSVARVTFPDSDSFQESFRRTADLRLGEGTTHMQLPPSAGPRARSWPRGSSCVPPRPDHTPVTPQYPSKEQPP